jgi:hypothetical protein
MRWEPARGRKVKGECEGEGGLNMIEVLHMCIVKLIKNYFKKEG